LHYFDEFYLVLKPYSLRMSLLAIVLTAALSIATPEKARAHESEFTGFYFKVEGRGNIAEGDRAPFAIYDDSNPANVYDTEVYDIGLDSVGSMRLGAGVKIGSAWDIGLLYSGLNKGQRGNIENNLGSNFIYQLNQNPTAGGGALAPYYSTQGTSEFTYDVVDFEAGYTFSLSWTNLRVFAGARYVDTNHIVSSYMFDAGGISPQRFEREIDQWAIGHALVLKGKYLLVQVVSAWSLEEAGQYCLANEKRSIPIEIQFYLAHPFLMYLRIIILKQFGMRMER
jgi:hypothetical protein